MELPATDKLVDAQRDALYRYDAAAQKALDNLPHDKKPWISDPNYFRSVRISAVALIKMVMHARSGGSLEVMGLMQGYVDGTALVVTDAFRLPVEGTETRVNAQDDANEYLVEYLRLCRDESRSENVVGWYHSHPGYGCWLSGIDVGTQHMQQQLGPFVAVVIDPDRTVSANKVEIGAFRTYPEGYKKPSSASSSTTTTADGSVPLNKAEDFGAHSNRYYALEVEHFRSSLDSSLLELLWNKYWVQTLAQNPLLTNREYAASQMLDLGHRVKDASVAVSRTGGRVASSALPGIGSIVGVGGGGLALGGGAGAQAAAVAAVAAAEAGGTVAGGPGGGSGRGAGGAGVSAAGGVKTVLDQNFEKIVRDAKQIAAKEQAGLMAAEVKAQIFSSDKQ